MIDPKIPSGSLNEKWPSYKNNLKAVPDAQRRKYKIVVIGAGLSGAFFASSMGKFGFDVDVFSITDSPRRAKPSLPDEGILCADSWSKGIRNAADLFFDEIRHIGCRRSRSADVYRFSQLSDKVIDLCVAKGVPFKRNNDGHLDIGPDGEVMCESPGHYILSAAYSALMKEISKEDVVFHPRHEMMDIVVKDGSVKGVVIRDLVKGKIFSRCADAVILACGGYSNIYHHSMDLRSANASALYRCYKKGACFANPSFVQLHPEKGAVCTLGGLWVDYNLMSTIPGLFVIGEANSSVHGASRVKGGGILQAVADGYFIAPFTVNDYLSRSTPLDEKIINLPVFKEAEAHIAQMINRLLNIKGRTNVGKFHRQLGELLIEKCGVEKNLPGLNGALDAIPKIREEFWGDVNVSGADDELNQELEYAARVADYMEFAELLAVDAITREETCGCHCREEFKAHDKESQTDDGKFSHVAVWEFNGIGKEPTLHKEEIQ